MFDGNIAEWNDWQVEFVSCCAFYHSIYSDYERPSNEVIEDDQKLDQWLALKARERKNEDIRRKAEYDNDNESVSVSQSFSMGG